MSWNVHRTIDDTIEWLKFETDNLESDKVYTWGFVLKDSGKLIGSGGFFWNEKHNMFLYIL